MTTIENVVFCFIFCGAMYKIVAGHNGAESLTATCSTEREPTKKNEHQALVGLVTPVRGCTASSRRTD